MAATARVHVTDHISCCCIVCVALVR